MKKPWFECWFDSPYYHLLYANRDHNEAEIFIQNILDFLKPKINDKVLDLGCGKGRHSLFLSEKDLNVTGIDLSANSINALKVFNSTNISFERWDMRKPYKSSHFDFVLNLFTSFGYFGSHEENLKVLKAVHYNLKEKGVVVLDYLNEQYVRDSLVETETIQRGDVYFKIQKTIEDGSIVKSIEFSVEGVDYNFEERVELISLEEFKDLFKSASFVIENVFGDYSLNDFDRLKSPRMIFVARKK